jgi:hypothetical protein
MRGQFFFGLPASHFNLRFCGGLRLESKRESRRGSKKSKTDKVAVHWKSSGMKIGTSPAGLGVDGMILMMRSKALPSIIRQMFLKVASLISTNGCSSAHGLLVYTRPER